MTIAVGAPLSEAFGSEPIKIKKKEKKKKDRQLYPINKHIYPQELKETINVFDDNFQEKSNIMPYGIVSNDDYESINTNEGKTHYGNFFPYDQYSFNGKKKEEVPPPPPQVLPSPQVVQLPSQVPPSPRVVQPLPQVPPSPRVVQQNTGNQYISNQDYEEFKQFKTQQAQIINQQKEKSQLIESFSNINDDFNDVLLFGLMGIFFLIFTDYIYKLGKKSY